MEDPDECLPKRICLVGSLQDDVETLNAAKVSLAICEEAYKFDVFVYRTECSNYLNRLLQMA